MEQVKVTELKIDNPAQRLLDILNAGKSTSSHLSCRQAWQRILKVPENHEQLLITRLGKVMGLPARINQVLQDHFPEPRWQSTHWRERVEAAFFAQEMNGKWENFIAHINDQAISELGLLSMIFETRGAHASINMDKINSLLEQITELRNDIRSAELPTTMKTMLLRQLAQLQEALETYSISGIEPVMDAVQSTLGLAVIDPDYKAEIKSGSGSKFGDRISSLLGDVANVVTVAGALPALPAAIQSALSLISK
ncbi:hypothetical protein NMY27_22150 (plasmid) [Cronobacter dublinensis subsp. beijingensis]|uniref:hypothetical protein n=1 Tax=Cronobacter dublinensis TaxID=413497 RepID=UPI0023DA8846|nr:hypothetical protein [Cronobacter dublinensis]WEP51942.1 hypothetical protein NMY27_22150 [Cronobacter dublinensis]